MAHFTESELILTPDHRVYHLNILNSDIADTVLLVGDQNRVTEVSNYFDKIDFKTQHREFITHTGTYKGKRITVLSTGIGTDNIDIVLNELDAAVNIDPHKRELRKTRRRLNLIRLGTSGALQPDLEVDSLVLSSHGIGMDGLLHFYAGLEKIEEKAISTEFIRQTNWSPSLPKPYCIAASVELLEHFLPIAHLGITATAPGFYAPQGRQIRLKAAIPQLNKKLADFRHGKLRIANFEMETSALYGLAKLLDHRCVTLCVVIANRAQKKFSRDPQKSVRHLIETALDKIAEIV
ncbi:MAG: nucleoside phosphorylase [bacterium]|nr:nucleoside phosphorylase [bacterium]